MVIQYSLIRSGDLNSTTVTNRLEVLFPPWTCLGASLSVSRRPVNTPSFICCSVSLWTESQNLCLAYPGILCGTKECAKGTLVTSAPGGTNPDPRWLPGIQATSPGLRPLRIWERRHTMIWTVLRDRSQWGAPTNTRHRSFHPFLPQPSTHSPSYL